MDKNQIKIKNLSGNMNFILSKMAEKCGPE